VRAALLGAGLSEAQTLSLLAPAFADRLGVPADHPWRSLISLANPLSEEESVLRPSLLPGLLFAAERNAARRVPNIALFEIGVAFENEWHDDPRGGRVATEHLRAGFVLTGTVPAGWHGERAYDFFDAKGIVERLASAIGSPPPAFAPLSVAELHPGRSASVSIGDTFVGVAGELHPRVARALDLSARVVVAELDLAALFSTVREPSAPELPRFPSADRDVAVIVPDTAAAAEVEAAVRRVAGDRLESLTLFDVYRSEQIGKGKVSLAYRLVFRHPERTLTDAEVSEKMREVFIALNLATDWGARI
jgi:phenylalanyl-tRNA synthetase beta chain